MALWHCGACTTAYSVGAPQCPQCGSTDTIKEDEMPKVTVHGGASHDLETPESPEEESSPGNSSATSSSKPEPSEKPSSSKGRSRARTTESHS